MSTPSLEDSLALRAQEALARIQRQSTEHGDPDLENAIATIKQALTQRDAPPESGRSTDRLERESALLRKAVQDTNTALEAKLEELSMVRLMTDATSRAVRSADPFGVLLEKIVSLLRADWGAIILVDWATQQHTQRAATGWVDGDAAPYADLCERTTRYVETSGASLLISDVDFDPAPLRIDPAVCASLLCFPLQVQNQTIGAVTLGSAERGHFRPATERIIHIIAGQLAVAVENTRLYDAIKETKDYLENLVDRAGVAIFTLTRRGIVDSWNTGARDIYRLGAREVIGRGLEAFVPESHLPTVKAAVDSVLSDGDIVTLQVGGMRGNGEMLSTDLTLSAIRDSGGTIVGVSGIASDITEQKRIEDELRMLNEAKSNFIQTVSHELRTPLTSIKSFVEIMEDETEETTAQARKRYLRIINEECDRLGALITDILDLQSVEAGSFELHNAPTVVADIVQQAMELYATVAHQREIELTADVPPDAQGGMVFGDRNKIYQVLANLLSNALKFTPAQGRISVSQHLTETEVRVTVRDSGMGFPPAESEKIFTKFYQVDNSTTRAVEGSGLGLKICREIVNAHGGRLWAESVLGEGATFHVWLPRYFPEAGTDAATGSD